MTQQDTFSASEFLASLPAFAPWSQGSLSTVSDDRSSDAPAVSVVGNLLVAFTADVDPDHQLELSYVMALVQLDAIRNRGRDPRSDPVGFYQSVTDTIPKIGFGADDVAFADYQARTQTVQLGAVASESLQGRLAQPQQAVVAAGMAALEAAAKNEGAGWAIFRDNAARDGAGSFAIGLAEMTSDRDGARSVSMTMSVLSFSGADALELSRDYASTRLSIRHGPTKVVVNDTMWNRPGIGSKITEKVRPVERGYIASLPTIA